MDHTVLLLRRQVLLEVKMKSPDEACCVLKALIGNSYHIFKLGDSNAINVQTHFTANCRFWLTALLLPLVLLAEA